MGQRETSCMLPGWSSNCCREWQGVGKGDNEDSEKQKRRTARATN
jgi:hypothetical protein